MVGGADVAAREVAVIAGCPKGEALLREQHQAYTEEAAAAKELSSSSALLQRKDFLERNAAAIEANSGDYTSWFLRRHYLSVNPEHINERELQFVRGMCEESLKNYQAWFHRRWLLSRLPVSASLQRDERDNLMRTLKLDLKNYSTWAHKSYLSFAFDLPFEEEVAGVESLLELDPYSNSAFAFLFCLLQRAATKASPEDALGIWLRPVKRYIPMFEERPSNESLVRFIVGCVKKAAAAAQQQQQQQELQEVLALLLAAAARVTAAGEGGERFGLEVGIVVDAIQHDYRAAAAKCVRLKESDPLRRFYWSWLSGLIGKQELKMDLL